MPDPTHAKHPWLVGSTGGGEWMSSVPVGVNGRRRVRLRHPLHRVGVAGCIVAFAFTEYMIGPARRTAASPHSVG